MHHFQLKPVRSLDSLRPAWSGHLRHGPPPSTVITNPREVPLKKSISSSSSATSSPPPASSHSVLSDNSVDRSKAFALNSLPAKSNRTLKEADETSLLPVPPASYNRSTESNRFLHELHVHSDLIKPLVDVSSCDPGKENKCEGALFPLNNREFNSTNVFANANSIPSTWDGEPFDRPSKTSNFLHEVNEDDPFDTSRVFTPSYLHNAPLFESTVPSIPAQFHPLSHPFNTTSCSAHAKVNIIVHYVFLCL